MELFGSQAPGLVAVARVTGGGPAVLSVSGPGGSLTGMGSVIVTSFNINLGVNNQYAPALDKSVYVYNFSDRIGTLQVQGLTFTRSCEGGGGDGLAAVLAFYANTRAVRDVKMRMAVDGSAFQGFLDRADIGSDNPEFKLGRFSLEASTLPSMLGF